jgi:hypothetical protein
MARPAGVQVLRLRCASLRMTGLWWSMDGGRRAGVRIVFLTWRGGYAMLRGLGLVPGPPRLPARGQIAFGLFCRILLSRQMTRRPLFSSGSGAYSGGPKMCDGAEPVWTQDPGESQAAASSEVRFG